MSIYLEILVISLAIAPVLVMGAIVLYTIHQEKKMDP